jgi:hypothetical protein
MPLQRCEGSGWRWGQKGKCYKGKDAKKRAIKQGLAVEGPENFKKVASATELLTAYLKDETNNVQDCSDCSE